VPGSSVLCTPVMLPWLSRVTLRTRCSPPRYARQPAAGADSVTRAARYCLPATHRTPTPPPRRTPHRRTAALPYRTCTARAAAHHARGIPRTHCRAHVSRMDRLVLRFLQCVCCCVVSLCLGVSFVDGIYCVCGSCDMTTYQFWTSRALNFFDNADVLSLRCRRVRHRCRGSAVSWHSRRRSAVGLPGLDDWRTAT